ncbi:MAG: lactate racemase domain-containing protein [Treponema sp.]|nr:lactate racemase domain-containing protein [Treponema sp.]
MPALTTKAQGSGPEADLSPNEIDSFFSETLSKALAQTAGKGPVLILPPDITRFFSGAGFLTDIAVRELNDRPCVIMPALGTHMPMTDPELRRMFPQSSLKKSAGLFRVHDWRNDVATLGRIEREWVNKASEGRVDYDWPVQVNKLLLEGGFSLIISVGQVVPHEVAGMANHTKNIFVGIGGKEAIDKSHFLGASYGMERIMGKTDNPVRALFDEGFARFSKSLPPVFFVQTVVSPRSDGTLATRGVFAGFDRECFEEAAALSREVNVNLLERPLYRTVVYLDPSEFRSTWVGNKAIYRTRMAMSDGGELLILAPGLEHFGEDKEVDKIIRKYGYRPSDEILDLVGREQELAENLSVAAHLIHGSSEGRFTVRYCPGPGITREEIESVGYQWGDLEKEMKRYEIERLSLGWNRLGDGSWEGSATRFFYVPNPALGLWSEREVYK